MEIDIVLIKVQITLIVKILILPQSYIAKMHDVDNALILFVEMPQDGFLLVSFVL